MVKGLAIALVVAAVCYTAKDIRDAECAVGCRRAGYDSGFSKDDVCLCTDAQPYEKVTHKKLVLPRRPKKPKPED